MSDKNPTHGDRIDALEAKFDRIVHRLAVALGLGLEDPPDTVLVEVPAVPSPSVPLGLEPPGMYRDPAIDAPLPEETVTAVATAAELPVLPTDTDPEHPERAPDSPTVVATDPSPANLPDDQQPK